MEARKVVQTEVDAGTHARLRHLAERKSVPLKAVVRDALRSYLARAEGDIEQDPAFQMIGCWDLKRKSWSQRKDWRA